MSGVPEVGTLTAFVAASLVVLLVPGPNLVYIVTRTLTQGRAAGLASVAGVDTATVVYVLATATGLSAVLAGSQTAYTTVRVAGAAYLVWLAVSTLRAPSLLYRDGAAAPSGRWKAYRDGAVVNLLNPKVAVFFVTFLPQFVPASASPTVGHAHLLVLGATFVVIALLVDVGVVVTARALQRRLRSRHSRPRLRLGVAGVYLGLAAFALFP